MARAILWRFGCRKCLKCDWPGYLLVLEKNCSLLDLPLRSLTKGEFLVLWSLVTKTTLKSNMSWSRICRFLGKRFPLPSRLMEFRRSLMERVICQMANSVVSRDLLFQSHQMQSLGFMSSWAMVRGSISWFLILDLDWAN